MRGARAKLASAMPPSSAAPITPARVALAPRWSTQVPISRGRIVMGSRARVRAAVAETSSPQNSRSTPRAHESPWLNRTPGPCRMISANASAVALGEDCATLGQLRARELAPQAAQHV